MADVEEAVGGQFLPFTPYFITANVLQPPWADPMAVFAMTKYSDRGITDHTKNEGTSMIIGAVKNKPLFALDGIIISLKNTQKKIRIYADQ